MQGKSVLQTPARNRAMGIESDQKWNWELVVFGVGLVMDWEFLSKNKLLLNQKNIYCT